MVVQFTQAWTSSPLSPNTRANRRVTTSPQVIQVTVVPLAFDTDSARSEGFQVFFTATGRGNGGDIVIQFLQATPEFQGLITRIHTANAVPTAPAVTAGISSRSAVN